MSPCNNHDKTNLNGAFVGTNIERCKYHTKHRSYFILITFEKNKMKAFHISDTRKAILDIINARYMVCIITSPVLTLCTFIKLIQALSYNRYSTLNIKCLYEKYIMLCLNINKKRKLCISNGGT